MPLPLNVLWTNIRLYFSFYIEIRYGKCDTEGHFSVVFKRTFGGHANLRDVEEFSSIERRIESFAR
jgi:hypothetical protein